MKLTCQQIENKLRADFETLDNENPIYVTHEDFLSEVGKIARDQFGEDTVVFPGPNPRVPEHDGIHKYSWSVHIRKEVPPIQTGEHGEPIHVKERYVWRDAFEVEAMVDIDCCHSFKVYAVSVR
jgi:hypothetical protein